MSPSKTLPKSARLRKSREFRFAKARKFQTDHFQFVYSDRGRGRLGISVSKKVTKLAVGRNRIKRLIRETFRSKRPALQALDLHVIARETLGKKWMTLVQNDVAKDFDRLVDFIGVRKE